MVAVCAAVLMPVWRPLPLPETRGILPCFCACHGGSIRCKFGLVTRYKKSRFLLEFYGLMGSVVTLAQRLPERNYLAFIKLTGYRHCANFRLVRMC